MPKPVYLAVLAISIVVAGVSLGVTLTRYLGVRAYVPKGTAQAASTAVGPDVNATPPEEWRNLFAPAQGMKLPSRLPAVNVKTGSLAPRSAFVLVGTIVSSTPSARRAVLWANGMKVPKAFREKEEVEPGAILASVERDKVWITRGAEREKLEILPVGTRTRSTATAAVPGALPAPPGAALPADPFATPWTAPGAEREGVSGSAAPPIAAAAPPPPAGARASVVPDRSSDDDEEDHLTPRQRRRRAQGLRR